MDAILNWFNHIGQSYYNALITEHRYMFYLEGLRNTLLISLLALLLGAFLGIMVAVIRFSAVNIKGLHWIKSLCNLYVTIIRGTPVLLQLLIIYNLVFTARNTNEIVVAGVCFGINSGAYVAEIVRAGIESIDKGQYEAGRSLGLGGNQTMFTIIMPQAIKNILPALGNEFIVLIKETSVASIIAVTDLSKAAQYIGSRTYDVIPPLMIAAVCYLVMVIGFSRLLHFIEGRMDQGDRN